MTEDDDCNNCDDCSCDKSLDTVVVDDNPLKKLDLDSDGLDLELAMMVVYIGKYAQSVPSSWCGYSKVRAVVELLYQNIVNKDIVVHLEHKYFSRLNERKAQEAMFDGQFGYGDGYDLPHNFDKVLEHLQKYCLLCGADTNDR